MTKNLIKKTAEKEKKNFDQKLQFTYPLASIKYVKFTEAFSSKKRPSNTSKHEPD
jgi:hypothetical protein